MLAEYCTGEVMYFACLSQGEVNETTEQAELNDDGGRDESTER